MLSTNTNPERASALLNSISEALIEIDENLKIVSVNKAVETMLGPGTAALVGESALSLLEQLTPASKTAASLHDALKDRASAACGDSIYRRKDGKELYLGWVVSPLNYPDFVNGHLLTLLDLSVRHELRIALTREREDFLAVLNHRLRTPVLAAERISQLFLEGQFGSLNQKQEELLLLLRDNVIEINRLMLMIMDIYKYRSSTKELKFAQTRVGNLFDRLRQSKSSSRVELQFEIANPEAVLFCDEGQVHSMLMHLIENAVKYARTKVKIQSQTASGLAIVSVSDDGTGIAEEDIQGLFERFYLISASGKYAPTTGAGLCLCSEIVKAHGGRISCKSELNKGTRFEIQLPLQSSAVSFIYPAESRSFPLD